jgi:hypothetical protein
MPAISSITRQQIKDSLERFVTKLVEQHKNIPAETLVENGTARRTSRKRGGILKPFHSAIIPERLLRISAFERSFSTSLGSTYEECARLIALEHHADAKRSFDVRTSVSRAALNAIERQVEVFEHAAEAGQPRPTLESMIETVLEARQADEQILGIRADLYIRTHSGEDLFFEMKSPVPNKGQCIEIVQRILRFHLLSGQPRPKTQAYFAMAYNPYGPTRQSYAWSMAKSYTPFDDGVLIGHEFWDIVGGPTAYKELLDIYEEVGKVKGKYIIDSLVSNF